MLDQSQAPLLQALADYHEVNRYGFTPPGHRQGRGVDASVIDVLGRRGGLPRPRPSRY